MMFQSTHPRGVRRRLHLHADDLPDVSIHAPAWGATRRTQTTVFWGTCFNPRTRVGCDRASSSAKRLQGVSIHAPAWGATFPFPAFCRAKSFNPRTRVGCDRLSYQYVAGYVTFQSTHPRGVRPDRRSSAPDVETVSIHAPAWGATTVFDRVRMMLEVSIHAPAWGATRGNYGIHQRKRAGFNPRTRVGCDADGFSVKPTTKLVSIHAPAWGATACCMSCAAWV